MDGEQLCYMAQHDLHRTGQNLCNCSCQTHTQCTMSMIMCSDMHALQQVACATAAPSTTHHLVLKVKEDCAATEIH